MSTTVIVAIIAFVVIVVAGIATLLFRRKRRTEGLRNKFGGTEYARAVKEAGLDKRTERVESFHVRPLVPADRARFEDSWRRIQTWFVDGPPLR